MASFFLAPDPLQSTFFIPGGATPGNGAQVFIYLAGTSTKQTVYKDNLGNTAWSNPIVLDSGGNLASGGVIWIPTGVTIKAVWAPANDTDPPASPYRTIDNIAGINDTNALVSEWISGSTPTFVAATQLNVSGDLTATLTPNRRLKTTNTAGTIYSTITQRSFASGSTAVNVVSDTGSLDSGLSALSYSIADPNNPSVAPGEIYRKAANVSSATNGTTDIWGIIGDYAHITGTTGIRHFSSAPYAGAQRTLIFDAVLTMFSSAALGIPGNSNISTAANDRAVVRADTVSTAVIAHYTKASAAPITLSPITSSLSGSVSLNNTANFFDGPSIAQGTAGTWLASGTVTLQDTAGAATFTVKLWDGTTVIAAAVVDTSAINKLAAVSLSGVITSPAGNIRISVKDGTSTSGSISFNSSGTSMDSTITAVRIA